MYRSIYIYIGAAYKCNDNNGFDRKKKFSKRPISSKPEVRSEYNCTGHQKLPKKRINAEEILDEWRLVRRQLNKKVSERVDNNIIPQTLSLFLRNRKTNPNTMPMKTLISPV